MAIVYREEKGTKLTIAELDNNFSELSTSLSVGMSGTNDFQFLFLSSGVTYSATFSFVNGILATHSTPYQV